MGCMFVMSRFMLWIYESSVGFNVFRRCPGASLAVCVCCLVYTFDLVVTVCFCVVFFVFVVEEVFESKSALKVC